jgi:tetratricopeptide (TPR) repeat protein
LHGSHCPNCRSSDVVFFVERSATVEARSRAEAFEKYARAIELNPRDARAYCNWGVALAEMGKRAEAAEKWRKAIELDPELKPQIEEVRKQLLGKE